MDYKRFQERLFVEADEGYRDFVSKGLMTERPLLGVRIPKCREIAKEVLAGKYGGVEDFLKNQPMSFEEVIICGFVIASLPYDKMKEKLFDFVQLIDSWEICDCFCATLKSVKKNRDDFLNVIDKLLDMSEFSTRVALVCLMDYYLAPEYLMVVFDRIMRVKDRTEYYVKMGVAWLMATSFAKFPEETMNFFMTAELPKWTHNKTISKACESYRVDKDLKEELKKLKQI